MARYVKRFPISGIDTTGIANQIGTYMTSEGFNIVNYNGQQVWKKGSGLLTMPQYMAITFTPQEVVVEAFIRYAILPGVYVGEMGIEGAMLAIPKGLLSKRVDAVQKYLYQLISTAQQ